MRDSDQNDEYTTDEDREYMRQAESDMYHDDVMQNVLIFGGAFCVTCLAFIMLDIDWRLFPVVYMAALPITGLIGYALSSIIVQVIAHVIVTTTRKH